MSRPRPKNLPAIGREIARQRRAGRPWKSIARSIEAQYGVAYGRTRLTQLMTLYGGAKSRN